MVFSNALIGLREGFEAALVVSILIAFLVKTGDHKALKWVWTGVGAAVALSVAIGFTLTYGTANMGFETQELVGGSLSILAVALVTGMIFWMRSTARTIAADLRGKLSDAVRLGPIAVIVVAFLSVGREGLETSLFFYAAVQTAGVGSAQPLIGFLIGIAVAIVLGFLLYRGAVKLNLAKFFKYTGIALIIVAAGVLAYGIHDLQEAEFLPGLRTLAFDLSGPIPESSWYGTLLKGIFNYSEQTTVLQAIAWVGYVAVVMTIFLWPRKEKTARPGLVRSNS
ncbi:high-affinity iron transporter [Kibdelosporangium banguiense]|uniref:High-affinity iron transporter n=1 Tax=Kibdelosporangium banguiense TaxID=1365924 RepID=A0ABS4T932_9PSEU|nr:iron uptake transporter permease EfeU [Kibdelosporangium banguiense]MBP2320941.1 high-affinity iron transporter [Kibdelosporangium banguiense]